MSDESTDEFLPRPRLLRFALVVSLHTSKGKLGIVSLSPNVTVSYPYVMCAPFGAASMLVTFQESLVAASKLLLALRIKTPPEAPIHCDIVD